MAEQPQDPDTSDAHVEHHELIEDRIETVTVRRAPKYSVFLLLGAALGIVTALVLTYTFGGAEGITTDSGIRYSSGQVFGFLALIFVAVGLAVGGTVALILDRTIGRRTREVRVDHESVHVVD